MTKNLMKRSDQYNWQEKIIEDKDIVQLQNLSTDIENINRKKIDDLVSDKSETEEIDKIEIPDEVIIIDRKKDKIDD